MSVNSFGEGFLKVLYDAAYLVLAACVLLVLMWIYVILKRWYGRARIARSRRDGIKAMNHAANSSEGINWWQHLSLKLTGEIYEIKESIFYFIFLCIVFALSFLFADDFLCWISSNQIVHLAFRVLGVIYVIAMIVYWISCFQSLIKYARVWRFIIVSALLVISIWGGVLAFF